MRLGLDEAVFLIFNRTLRFAIYVIIQVVGSAVASVIVFLAIVPPNTENAWLTLPSTRWIQSFSLSEC